MTESGLQVAIVGAGLMGRFHADAAARSGARVVAVVDPRPERARGLAAAAGAVTAESLADLGPGRSIDVVHICTPLAEHSPIAAQALELGAHLVVEKPLTPDAATTAALLSAATDRGSLVVPVHQFLFQPGIQRLLAEGERFGSLVRCVFEAHTAGAELTGVDPDELVADVLPHPLALFARLTTVALSDLDWLVMRPEPGELRGLADADGTTLEIVISTHARPARTALDLVGSEASAHADLYHGFATVERGSGTGLGKVIRPFSVASATFGRAGINLTRRALTREVGYPGLRELVRRTYEAIATRSAAPISVHETMEVALARDAILSTTAAARM